MADVSIYVALVTAGAGILGAAIPQVSMVLRDVRKDKRERRDRQADQARQAFVDLLRAASELRTQIANNITFQGDRKAMGERLERVRLCSDAAWSHAANVALMLPDRLADPAERLAAATAILADSAVQYTDLDLGRMIRDPGFGDLDARMAEFRNAAKAHALAIEADSRRVRGLLAQVRRRGAAVEELDQ